MLHHYWTVLAQTLAQAAMLDREMMAILGVSLMFGATFYLVASDRVGTLRGHTKNKPAA